MWLYHSEDAKVLWVSFRTIICRGDTNGIEDQCFFKGNFDPTWILRAVWCKPFGLVWIQELPGKFLSGPTTVMKIVHVDLRAGEIVFNKRFNNLVWNLKRRLLFSIILRIYLLLWRFSTFFIHRDELTLKLDNLSFKEFYFFLKVVNLRVLVWLWLESFHIFIFIWLINKRI